jgi:hypothetical protein
VRRRGTHRLIRRCECGPIRPSRGRSPRLRGRRSTAARARAPKPWPSAPTAHAPTPRAAEVWLSHSRMCRYSRDMALPGRWRSAVRWRRAALE